MNIDALDVKGLFGSFDHRLSFCPNERVMIMIGPNGYGKTMTLRIVDSLFNHSFTRLARLPFWNVTVSFDNQSELVVQRSAKIQPNQTRLPLRVSIRENGKEVSKFTPTKEKIDTRTLDFPVAALDDIIPVIERAGARLWRNVQTNELMDLEDVLLTFGEDLPGVSEALSSSSPDWLKEIKDDIRVRLIGTERLTGASASVDDLRKYGRRVGRPGWAERYITKRTVRVYSEELAKSINQAMTDYGTLSQSTDRTFPARVVADSSNAGTSIEELRDNLDEIETRRQELEDVGLLAREEEQFDVPSLDSVDASRHPVLHVYAKDAKQKLSLFDDLYEKVSSFRRIINSRFLYKHLVPGKSGLSVVSNKDQELDLEMLSSGEQHELVIIYELLFRTMDNSLIMIDEPELSLHVAWQEKFLGDLQEMAQLSNFRAILATHSPEIIGERWDLTVELQGPAKNAKT